MLISYSHDFVFVHVPKTGGSSITQALNPYANQPAQYLINRLLDRLGIHVNYLGSQRMRRFRTHATAMQLRRHLPAKVYNGFFKFAFVRNPWDRMVSYYSFLAGRPNHHRHQRVVSLGGFREYLLYEIARSKTTQKSILSDQSGQLIVNFVGRFESLRTDFAQICRHLGIPFQLEHVNKTIHRDYREYYDRQTIRLVQDHFWEDIEFFQYTFDGAGSARNPLKKCLKRQLLGHSLFRVDTQVPKHDHPNRGRPRRADRLRLVTAQANRLLDWGRRRRHLPDRGQAALTGDASPAVDTDATSARERDTGERRDAGRLGSDPVGQHLPDRGQATVTAGHVGGDRVAKSPRRSLVLAQLGHIHLGHLLPKQSGESSTTTCPKNSSQLRTWVSMTQAGIGNFVAHRWRTPA